VREPRILAALYRGRRAVTLAVYATVAAGAYTCAFLLRYDFAVPEEAAALYFVTLPIVVLVRLLCTVLFRLSSGRWRFTGTGDVLRLVAASTAGSVLLLMLTWGLPTLPAIPRSILALEWLLTSYLTAGIWLVYRTVVEQFRIYRAHAQEQPTRILIVGAGEAGYLLAREMTRQPTGYRPLGYVDDDPLKRGTSVGALQVLGSTDQLPELTRRLGVEELVIAVPSAGPEQFRRIVASCEASDVRFKVLPGMLEVMQGKVRLNQLRDLRIEDLLGREPVSLELPELFEYVSGRTILITGAAGSIGSELSRQVALHEPARLVLLDQAETELFFLERDLRSQHPALQVTAVVGDVADETEVARIFREHRPQAIYHAAAYKHVGMMEGNVRQAVRNNVLGTQLLAEAAADSRAERFVLVSTDKAVNPTSIMGATKRLAELVVLDIQRRHAGTSFTAVRFGNVLGSSGSVLPIFRRQLDSGQPLTVTDAQATRYFMTIPEAVQLILQASLLPEMRGHIAMLDMGEPVRIADLAANLLRLSGIPHRIGETIVFTGLQPGEKLHEELRAPDEVNHRTVIPKVLRLETPPLTLFNPAAMLRDWEQAFLDGRDGDVVHALAGLFPELTAALPELDESRVSSAGVSRAAGTFVSPSPGF
jgi:FlaA1/EpsC-like NDP-sugar epimerase